jgi:DNA gyrase subunit B
MDGAASMLSRVDNDYGADKIQALEGLEAVRKRPGWYIGGTGSKGLHHCIYEIVDNSVDEALAGYCTEITVIIHIDNSVTVIDDGRGIPVGIHPIHEIPGVELVYTRLHTGAKFNEEGGAYKVAGGLHGVGAAAVNALSSRLQIKVKDGKHVHEIVFERGETIKPLTVVGDTQQTGTQVTFKPDHTVFEVEEFNYGTLESRFREMAYLNSGLKIILKDERSGKENTFHYEGGLREFVTWLNRAKTPIHKSIVHLAQANDECEVEVALQWTDSYSMALNSYANTIGTTDGGTHVAGFKTAITRTINQYIKDNKLHKSEKFKLSGDDVREGLTAIVAIKLPVLQFDSQLKSKLVNSEAEGVVNTLVGEGLKTFFEENPKVAKTIIQKSLSAAAAREAARKARQLSRKKTGLSGSIPDKMASCISRNPEECEIYIVEGDSAGGSAKQARDSKYQAVLPLRGKILNVEKARYDKILANNEIKMFIQALGAGIGKDDFDINKVRYHKVIIMTDADVDGSHIRTLILTLIYRQFPSLLEKGYVYIAQPPLFKVKKGRGETYLKDEKALENHLIIAALNEAEISVGKKGAPGLPMETELIESLVKKFTALMKQLEVYDTYFDTPLLTEMVKNPNINAELLKDKGQLEAEFQVITTGLTTTNDLSSRQYSFEIKEDLDNEANMITLIVRTLARVKNFTLRMPFLDSIEFETLRSSYEGIQQYLNMEFTYKRGQAEESFDGLESFVDFIVAEGQRGAKISRYKGLGEMDPDQLWETTMDPENRRLLQVQISDLSASDQVFSVLMGNRVEPRRDFVETNALRVRNLDV